MRIPATICILSICLLCLITTAINITSITWSTLPTTLPFNRDKLMTTFDIHTGLVWILSASTREIYQWNITNNIFTYINALSPSKYNDSFAQNWVTKNRLIYWVESNSIRSFNTTSALEITNDLDAFYPYRTRMPCVTTDNDKYLIIIGGYPYKTYTQIYSFETKAWLSNIPLLNQGRYSSSCHVYNASYVYTIAGFAGSTRIRTVEKLDLDTMRIWITSPHELIQARSSHRSVLINDFIIVTGGWDGSSALKSVEIISMVDDSITRGPDLNIAVYRHGIIGGPMNNVIVLGGYTSNGATNKIQVLNTLSSTRAPVTSTTEESDDNSDTETTDGGTVSNNWMSTTVDDGHYESRKKKAGKEVALVIAILLVVVLMVTACVWYISQRKNMKSNVETVNGNYEAM